MLSFLTSSLGRIPPRQYTLVTEGLVRPYFMLFPGGTRIIYFSGNPLCSTNEWQHCVPAASGTRAFTCLDGTRFVVNADGSGSYHDGVKSRPFGPGEVTWLSGH